MISKQLLRKRRIAERKTWSLEFVEEISLQIANHLIKAPIWGHENYHIFLPIQKNNEIDTTLILPILQAKDKNVVISRTDFETKMMHHHLLTDQTTLKLNSYGIPEPQGGIPVADQAIDVVFIPLLAVHKNGHRIGYGGGFYDRFLSNLRRNTIKVGLSQFELSVDNWEVESHDIPLDLAITPNQGVIYFRA